jgi:heterodisulfide reductase subunit C
MYALERAHNGDLDRIALRDMARLCYTCGICVGDCPAARFSDDFNPRQIFLKVCLGIEEGLIGKDSPIWKCTTCYTCYERCPAGVKPLDIILALRNVSFTRGSCPENLKSVRTNVLATGVVGTLTRRISDLRAKMGLPGPEHDTDLDLERLISEQ